MKDKALLRRVASVGESLFGRATDPGAEPQQVLRTVMEELSTMEKMAGRRSRVAGDVDGGEVLNRVYHFVRRFVAMTESQAVVTTLWIAHTHVYQLFLCTPYLIISSPEKRSGKTTTLEVIESLAANNLLDNVWTTKAKNRKETKNGESP